MLLVFFTGIIACAARQFTLLVYLHLYQSSSALEIKLDTPINNEKLDEIKISKDKVTAGFLIICDKNIRLR